MEAMGPEPPPMETKLPVITSHQKKTFDNLETHDPNYQTMAGVGGDAFGPDKKKVRYP